MKHQLTEEMWAEILTKPLQGAAFRQMQAKLMNCKKNYEEDEMAFHHSMAKAGHARKTIPATRRVAKQGPTQTLQECNRRFQYSRRKQVKDRQLVGM